MDRLLSNFFLENEAFKCYFRNATGAVTNVQCPRGVQNFVPPPSFHLDFFLLNARADALYWRPCEPLSDSSAAERINNRNRSDQQSS